MPKRPFSIGLTERLQDPDYVTEYLNSALQDSNEGFLLALRDVADAQSMTEVAKSSQLNRVNLYRMLSERGNPRLSSLVAVLDSLGLEIRLAKHSKFAVAHSDSLRLGEIAHSAVGAHEAAGFRSVPNILVQGKTTAFGHGFALEIDGNVIGIPRRKLPGRETEVASNGLLSHSAFSQYAANS